MMLTIRVIYQAVRTYMATEKMTREVQALVSILNETLSAFEL